MKLNEIKIKDYKSASILNESWQELTESQQLYIGKWETSVWPLVEQYSRLMEADLNPQQIQKIFKSAEQVLNATGKNTTALGKYGKLTADVATKIKTEIEKLATAAQQTAPIQNIDNKFEQLKTRIKQELNTSPQGRKLLATVDTWGEFAKNNPGKSAFILGAMTSILAFASGGMASGAAIGLFIKLSNNLIKGDKLSTAVGKSAKGAAMGAAAGLLGDIFNGSDIEIDTSGTGESNVSIDTGSVDPTEIMSTFASEEDYLRSVAEELYNERLAGNSLAKQYKDKIIQRMIENFETSGDFGNGEFVANLNGGFPGGVYLNQEEYAEFVKLGDAAERMDYVKSIYEESEDEFDFDPEDGKKVNLTKQESVEYYWDQLDEYELREAPAFLGAIGKAAGRAADAIGKAAEKGAAKAAKGASAAGKELGSKVTVDKLLRVWKRSGSPTDVNSIINILKDQGLSDQLIGTVAKQSRIDLTANNPAVDTKPEVDLTALAQQLRSLGIADEVKRVLDPRAPEDRPPEFKSKRNEPVFKTTREKPPVFKSVRQDPQPVFKSTRK